MSKRTTPTRPRPAKSPRRPRLPVTRFPGTRYESKPPEPVELELVLDDVRSQLLLACDLLRPVGNLAEACGETATALRLESLQAAILACVELAT